MKYNVKVKNGIAFNLDDEYQHKLYEHICSIPNVSSYLKRLIGMDMTGGLTFARVAVQEEEIEEVELDESNMLGLI